MGRPKGTRKTRKAQQELLGECDLYRLIKQHSEVTQYGTGLTMEQIRSVFRAYADIMNTAVRNNLRINLPYVGEFFPNKVEGFKGGMVNIADNPFQKGTTTHKEYRPPKPDYKIIRFEIRRDLQNKFKEETLEDDI